MTEEEIKVLKEAGFEHLPASDRWTNGTFCIRYDKLSYYPYRVIDVSSTDKAASEYTNFSDAFTAATPEKRYIIPETKWENPRIPPKRYENEELDVEVVEMYYRIYGKEALLNALRFNILKYRIRMGNKEGESLEKEMSKVKDYLAIKQEYESKVQ